MQIRIFVLIEDGLAILHLEVIQVLQELLRGIRKEGSLLIRVDRGISRIRMKMEGKEHTNWKHRKLSMHDKGSGDTRWSGCTFDW